MRIEPSKKKAPGAGGTKGPKECVSGLDSKSGSNGQANNSALKEWALDYLQQGWSVMRLPPRSKEPYKKKPFPTFAAAAITNDNVHTLKDDENLGIVFKTAGALKDLDLDFQTAVDLAQAVRLKGAAFGRGYIGGGQAGTIVGHYLFDAPGCEAKKFVLPEAKKGSTYPRELPQGEHSHTVLEIRGNDNTYTMFPPSVHPCGDQLNWVGTRREPAKTTAAELRALAGRHAVAAAVLYFYPSDAPARYDCRMALTGALARSGMPADDVALYVQGVAKLAGDPKWKENHAERTEKRLEQDKTVTGLTKLIEVLQLPDACRDTFYEWLHDLPEHETPDGDGDAPKPEMPEREWPVLDPAALYGLTGEVVNVIGPHTESDMVALVMQFHIAFGNAIGRSAYYQVEGTEHYTNLYGVLVGQSGKSRKGTSGDRIQQLMSTALALIRNPYNPTPALWVKNCIQSGLSSGEGVIWHIRDEVREPDEDDEKGRDKIKSQGVEDKRMLLDEREFAQCFAMMKRDGNTASIVVRKGWDSKPLGNLSKNNPAKCDEPHISICGHITTDELRSSMDQTSMASGYANRFLFACVKRSKLLPHGGNLQQSDLDVLAKKVKAAFDKVYAVKKRFDWDAKARTLWEKVYPELTEGTPGLLGAICGRAEAQTVRLALIYAVLDGSDGVIKLPHLKAALALWKYYEASVLYVFGDSLGDPVADTILAALRNNPNGLTRTQIRDLFARNQNSGKVGVALSLLVKRGMITSVPGKKGGRGRPIEVWVIKS